MNPAKVLASYVFSWSYKSLTLAYLHENPNVLIENASLAEFFVIPKTWRIEVMIFLNDQIVQFFWNWFRELLTEGYLPGYVTDNNVKNIRQVIPCKSLKWLCFT